MEFATYSDIEIAGLQGMQKLIEMEIFERLNDHSKAIFSVYVDPGYDKEQFVKENSGVDVQIKVKGNLIFSGYVTKMQDIGESKLHIYKIEISSYSRKLDCKVRSRVYQEVSNSYEYVVKQIMKNYNNAIAVWEKGSNIVIGNPVFQYMETDWEFIKRLASSQNQSVIVNVYATIPYLILDRLYNEYDTEGDYKYLECGVKNPNSCRYYRIECAKDYCIGVNLRINEGVFQVIQKHTKIVEAELRYEYFLAVEEFAPDEMVNNSLVGLQLAGTVSEVKEDQIQVQFDISQEDGECGEYFFDWKPISSNIMYAMPEKNERVHLRIADAKGKNVVAINCLRQNGNTCDEMKNPNCKIMNYNNKKMQLSLNEIGFSNNIDTEVQQLLKVVDVEGIVAQVKSQLAIEMRKGMKLHSKNGKVEITTPYQIVLKNSNEEQSAEIALHQTVECKGGAVEIEAEVRIQYPIINDAPIVVKNGGIIKLLEKVALTVLVVAAVAGFAAMIALSGGLAAAGTAAAAVAIGAMIGGGVTAGIGFISQVSEDRKNGIKREWWEYLYKGVDDFCTGAIVTAPMATPWGLPAQLLTVGICSFTYQMIDNGLDERYGSDFYDEDSNMLLTIVFDVALAGLASGITKGLNHLSTKIINLPKSAYISIAKILNKIPNEIKVPYNHIAKFLQKISFKKIQLPIIEYKYPVKQGHINDVLKKEFRAPLRWLQGKLQSKAFIYLILGGKENKPGADLVTSLLTDPNVNPLLGWLLNNVEYYVDDETYAEEYNSYSRIVYDDDKAVIIDFDEKGNLVFE